MSFRSGWLSEAAGGAMASMTSSRARRPPIFDGLAPPGMAVVSTLSAIATLSLHIKRRGQVAEHHEKLSKSFNWEKVKARKVRTETIKTKNTV